MARTQLSFPQLINFDFVQTGILRQLETSCLYVKIPIHKVEQITVTILYVFRTDSLGKLCRSRSDCSWSGADAEGVQLGCSNPPFGKNYLWFWWIFRNFTGFCLELSKTNPPKSCIQHCYEAVWSVSTLFAIPYTSFEHIRQKKYICVFQVSGWKKTRYGRSE